MVSAGLGEVECLQPRLKNSNTVTTENSNIRIWGHHTLSCDSRACLSSTVWCSMSRPKSRLIISSRTSSILASTLSMQIRKWLLVSSQLLRFSKAAALPSHTPSQRFTAEDIRSQSRSVSAVCWAMPVVLVRISATRGRHCSTSDDKFYHSSTPQAEHILQWSCTNQRQHHNTIQQAATAIVA